MARLIAPFTEEAAETVAARLLARFGSLNRALTAAAELDDPGDEDAAVLRQLRAAGELVQGAAREQIARQLVDARDAALHRYLRHQLAGHPAEHFHAVFVDAAAGYLTDEGLARGASGRLEASIRHLVARALNLGARGVILAHNHPSGVCRPSAEDIVATERIRQLAAAIDLVLLDHLIVTRNQTYSFAAGELV